VCRVQLRRNGGAGGCVADWVSGYAEGERGGEGMGMVISEDEGALRDAFAGVTNRAAVRLRTFDRIIGRRVLTVVIIE
jgi:hypothetical protein